MNKMKMNLKLGLVLLALFAILPVFVSSGYIIQSLIMVLLYAYWSSAYNIVSGFAGQLSIGHAAYIGTGAYVTAILFNQYHVSPWIGMVVGGIAASILSAIISFPCFKLQGSYFTLSTVALSSVVLLIVLQEDYILGFKTNGAMGIKVPWRDESFANLQFLDKRYYYYVILTMLILVVLLAWKIKNSKTGYYLAAIKTNQDAAASLGVNTVMYKLRAMMISSFLVALGGGFYAMLIQFLDPARILGYKMSVEVMMYAVVGGLGTIAGPLLGAFILVPISEVLRSNLGASYAGLADIIFGLILMTVVFFEPQGLMKLVKKFHSNKKVENQSTDSLKGELKS